MLISYVHLAPVITLPVVTPTGSCNYRQELILMQISSNSIKMWNSLPYDYTNISDLNQFR